MGLRNLLFLGDDAAGKLARWDALLLLSAVPCSLVSLVSTLVFYRTGDALSHENSST